MACESLRNPDRKLALLAPEKEMAPTERAQEEALKLKLGIVEKDDYIEAKMQELDESTENE